MFPKKRFHTISHFAVLAIVSPVALTAQSALVAVPGTASAAAYTPGGQVLGRARAISFASLLASGRDDTAIYADNATSVNRQAIRGEAPQINPAVEKRHEMAFLTTSQSGIAKSSGPSKVLPIILSLAVHAAVTWDAESTNHFFHHYPQGYKPVEVDPLMRPFAGKAPMYPMANLLFAAPFDLLNFKTAHSRKPLRIFTYAAEGVWAGLEMHQSMVNMGNERSKSVR